MGFDRWNVAGYARNAAATLFREGYNPLLAVVLASRGYTNSAEVEALIGEGSAPMDPYSLRDMEKAVARIRLAVQRSETVAVYGDYDVDGITSTCVMTDCLRSMGLACLSYIPKRLEEGYGVRKSGIDALHARGVKLIVTVDYGVTACKETEYAESLGIDFVITDHHECGEKLPNVPVVNPKRPDNPTQIDSLAGVGVAFQTVCALLGTENRSALLEKYAELVALGTLADVMPVLGENRLLIRAGLEKIRRDARPGIAALCTAAGIEREKLSVTGVGFALAPRLNAVGRLGPADIAVELLTTDDGQLAQRLSEEMNRLNRERQNLESDMLADAVEMLEKAPPEGKPIVLASDKWHQGVAGIVASRLGEKYRLPAVMICLQDGAGRGSCRSVAGFNLFEALRGCSDLLTGFGGHEMAAGLTVPEENVDALRERLGEIYAGCGAAGQESVLRVDAILPKAEILTVENIEALDALEPCGNENPAPVLALEHASVRSYAAMGGGRHTRLRIRKGAAELDCVCFGKSPEELGLVDAAGVSIAFLPQINEYRGRRSVQLVLQDLRAE